MMKKKPECVVHRDQWLFELQQTEDREALRPHLKSTFAPPPPPPMLVFTAFLVRSPASPPRYIIALQNMGALARRRITIRVLSIWRT